MPVIRHESDMELPFMNRLHLNLFLASWAGLQVLASGTFCHAAEENELPRPDQVTLKAGSPLPPGITTREINGAILEESDTELRLETSKFRGISNLLTLPTASIESVKRGDHAERDYALLKPLLQSAETSATADYYQKELLPQLESYIAKHPSGPRTLELSSILDTAKEDLRQVLQEDIRFGGFWLRRKELSPEYRADLLLWQQLQKGMTTSSAAEFNTLTDKILLAKNRPYYPYLVEKTRIISGLRIQSITEALPDPALASANQPLQNEIKILSTLQAVDTGPLKKAVSLLGRIQQTVDQPVLDLPEVKALLAECRLLWPELDGTDHVLLQGFRHQLHLAEAGTGQSKQSLKNASDLLPLIQKAPPTLKSELETASKQQTIQQLMQEAVTLLDKGAEAEAIARINRIRGMIPAESTQQQALQDLTLKATELLTSKGIEDSRAFQSAGDREAALDALRKTEIRLVSYGALDTQRADLLAEECVAIASQSAKKLQLITSIKASYAGWSISPTNIKARISCIIVVVSILATALVFFMVLLMVWSYVSNILHKDRFDKRLHSLREDEKSRRISSARRRKTGGQK